MRIVKAMLACVIMTLPLAGQASVVYSFTDPVGDSTGGVDITGMTFTIDEVTGDYTIDLTADAANPFAGDFRININLFNVTRDEFFADTFNDYSGYAPATSLSLSGANADLTDWLATDVLATSTFDGYGNPAGTSLFRSSVADLPFQPICVAEDVIGYDGCSTTAVPGPPVLALLALGLIGIGAARHRLTA